MLIILEFWHLPVVCCFPFNWLWLGNFHLKIFTKDSFCSSSTLQDLGPDAAVICCAQINIAAYRTSWNTFKKSRRDPSMRCSVRAANDQCVEQVTKSLAHAGWAGRWSLPQKPIIHFLNCTFRVKPEVAVARWTEIVSCLFILVLGKKEKIERKNACNFYWKAEWNYVIKKHI